MTIALVWFIAVLLSALESTPPAAGPMIITQTRSTNQGPITITVDPLAGTAYQIQGTSAPLKLDLQKAESLRLWKAARAALPLASLPAAHCAKSASFGTSIFVQIGSDRSPDLSCPALKDTRATELAAEVRTLLQQARQKQRPR